MGALLSARYWDLTRTESASEMDEDDAVDLLGEHLGDSVALSLRSDAPVGVFLSGGVDSSLLTWLASVRASAPLRTFSVVFAEPQFDEREFSRMVARAYGTEHEEIQVSPQEAADALVHLCGCLDEPFADSSAIPTYLLAHACAAVGQSGPDGGGLRRAVCRQPVACERRRAVQPRDPDASGRQDDLRPGRTGLGVFT